MRPLDLPAAYFHDPRGIDGALFLQKDRHGAPVVTHPRSLKFPEEVSDPDHRQQILRFGGNRSIAVQQTFPDIRQFFIALRQRDPFVGHEPLVLVGHVGFGDKGGNPQMDFRSRLLFRRRLPLDLPDRLLHELRIKLVAHGGYVPGLRNAEKIPGPADIQVVGGDPETRTRLREVHDHLEPFLGVPREHRPFRNEKVGKGLLLRPPHPSPDLVELPQAEAVRPIDDDRVRRRDVQARPDDRRADQDVVLPPDEPPHRILDLRRFHPAVDHPHLRLRHEPLNQAGHRIDRPDPVVEEENLTVSCQLAAGRIGNHLFVEFQDMGLDRQPILRRGIDDGEIPDPDERQMERPRNGGSGEGENIHQLPQFLELFLVADPETLLLVDDDHPEVPEGHVLLEKPVGADDDVHRPAGQAVENLPLFRLCAKAVENLHADRVGFQTAGKGLVVLLGQDRRGNENRHLLPVERGPKRRPHRHLGLAESRVAADQAIHRFAAVHVDMDLLDGLRLVRRLLVLEGGTKLVVDSIGGGKGLPAHHLPGGVDGNQLLGHLTDRLLDPFLDRLPGGAAQLVHLRLESVRPDVALDLIDPVHRKVKAVIPVVFDHQKIVLNPAGRQFLQTPVAADALLLMDDEIPFGQFPEGFQEIPFPGRARPPPQDLFSKDLLFGKHDELHPRPMKASADLALPECQDTVSFGMDFQSPLAVQKRPLFLPDSKIVPRQKLPHPLHAFLARTDIDDLVSLSEPGPDLFRERLKDAGLFRLRPGRRDGNGIPFQLEPDGRGRAVFASIPKG